MSIQASLLALIAQSAPEQEQAGAAGPGAQQQQQQQQGSSGSALTACVQRSSSTLHLSSMPAGLPVTFVLDRTA